MKAIIVVLALGFTSICFGQKEIELKRKFRGSYDGIIPEYTVQVGDELIFVAETPISISIGENQVQVNIGVTELFGTFEVMFEAQKYYLLDVKIEGQLATERIMVYKSGDKLSREGMFPQPVTGLKKSKRKK